MNINIRRYNKKNKSYIETYDILLSNKYFIDIFDYIRDEIDSSFTYSSGCKSGICGICSVRVNGKEMLSCSYIPKDNDLIEPLNYVETMKDLKVDLNKIIDTIRLPKAYLDNQNENIPTRDDTEKIILQSKCILCASCYSSCPVIEINKKFLGPFVLTKVYQSYMDVRESNKKEKLQLIQENGIWDCTLCGNCAVVCPQGIMSDMDIKNLQMISVQNGFINNKQDNTFSQDGFGFNPN